MPTMRKRLTRLPDLLIEEEPIPRDTSLWLAAVSFGIPTSAFVLSTIFASANLACTTCSGERFWASVSPAFVGAVRCEEANRRSWPSPLSTSNMSYAAVRALPK
jgi:hypothetical protein